MGSPDETTAEGIPPGQPGARKCPQPGCACGGSVRHATPTPPAPADDARPMVTGGGLIKFDRRADDASGAEAMRGVRGCADMTPFFGAKHERGLYGKFRVERTDGKSAPGQKHDGCRYFVLDLDHDTLAPPAIRAYAKAAREAGYVPLADDLDALYATPLPARDDAVEEAMAPGCHEHVALWDAINAYSAACGGHPTRGGGARMDAVVRVEKALRAALRRAKGGA